MRITKTYKVTTLLLLGLFAGMCGSTAIADDDVAALVVDNGPTLTVPEPGVSALLLAGAVAAGFVARRNRNKKVK